MSSNGPHSHPLRPYSTPSSAEESVAFVATAPARQIPVNGVGGSINASASSSASRAGAGTPYAPISANASNRYAFGSDAALDEAAAVTGESAGSVRDWARVMAMSAALSYTSTCLAMPFEVGKLLLQIQWVPKDDVWIAFGEMDKEDEMVRMDDSSLKSQTRDETDLDNNSNDDEDILGTTGTAADWADDANEPRDFGAEDDELSDEDDADAYFKDLKNQPSRPAYTPSSSRRKHKKQIDSSGYVLRKSVHEDSTRPDFVMPVVVRGGVWEMIKAVGRGKEGWLGLWKGSLTTFIIDTVTSTVQPIVSFTLSFISPSALTPLPLPYAPYPYRSLTLLLCSHLVTGVLVSPLDLVRTRLIAQSTLPPHRKYTSPWNALQQILHEEGGWRTVYFHPNLLIPTILDFTVRPLLSLASPLFIEHKLRLDPITSPVRYSLAEFCISNLSLLVTLPIETVRRRLQLQARAAWGKKIVKLHGSRPKPNHRSSLSSSSITKAGSASEGVDAMFASATGAIPQAITAKPLRTCVETRPKPYEGVTEAIYRILTEETSITPMKSIKSPEKGKGKTARERGARAEQDGQHLKDSGILAKPGSSSFGGVYSLYRGLGFSIGANALVFVLTIVTGERAHANAGWTEI